MTERAETENIGAGGMTGAVRTKMDAIWTQIWAGGLTNPISVIEQLTYLMFLRSLDDKELGIERMEAAGVPVTHIFPQSTAGQSMRWSKFRDLHPEQIFDLMTARIFPALKAMHGGRLPDFDAAGKLVEVRGAQEEDTAFARYMSTAMFQIPTPAVLAQIIAGLDELYRSDLTSLDMQGDLYEYMLSKLATAGQNGQFRTPKHIRALMVELLRPTAEDVLVDPACGTAGFLVSAAEYIRAHEEHTMTAKDWDHFARGAFTGFDTDQTMLRISAMNLMLHAITHPEIRYLDSVSKENEESETYTICLANPPFKGTLNAANIAPDLAAVTKTKKTELLFVALFLRLLKKGGRCACIVPDGVLFGTSKAHRALREELVERHTLEAVISMPSGVFKPYAGVSTAILVFTKTGSGGTERVWFYDMAADGYSLDDKRSPIDRSDIPDIIARFHNRAAEEGRARTEQSFLVPKEEIAAADYDLSINKYKTIEYVPVEYPPTEEILAEIERLETEIAAGIKDLRAML